MSKILTRRPALIVPADYSRPMAPLAFSEAIAKWGQTVGRRATLRWAAPKDRVWHDQYGWVDVNTGLACWSVELQLRPTDPSLRAWQEQRLKQDNEPTESILLIDFNEKAGNYVPLNLEEIGVSGLIERLERGNTWTGRGEFSSMQEAFFAASKKSKATKEATYLQQKNFAMDMADAFRRQIRKIPYLRVGIDLKGSKS